MPASAATDASASGAGAVQPQVVGTSPSGGQLVFDPSLGAVLDTANGDIYDPATGTVVGNVAQLQRGGAAAGRVGAGTGTGAGTAPTAAGQSTTGGPGTGAVYVDPQTGRYVDPTSGLSADPATGQVYDTQGRVVGNVDGARQPAA